MSTVLFILVGGYAAVCLVVFLLQSRLLYHPLTRLEATPQDVGLAFEDVFFTAADNTRLHGWHVPAPARTDDANTTVAVFCHGNAGNISHRLETLKLLNGLGIGVFLFDYRGYGQSQGSPSEAGTARDAVAAFDWLVAHGVSSGRILAWGRSLGGAVAARLATERTPAALIIESSFTSVPDMAARVYPFLPVRKLSRFSYNTRNILPQLNIPILIAHSPEDEIVPFAMGRSLFEHANEPRMFLELAGGHNNGFLQTGTAYKDGIRSFLRQAKLIHTAPRSSSVTAF